MSKDEEKEGTMKDDTKQRAWTKYILHGVQKMKINISNAPKLAQVSFLVNA